jgi:hypothetical protein
MAREIKTVVVEWWDDNPTAKEVMGDCMLMLSPGIYYHARLDTTFMILSDMPVAVAAHLR